MFFKERKTEATPESNKQTRRIPPAPEPDSFNFLETESWSGDFVIPAVRMTVSLAYRDWCELQKSKLFRDFEHYLLELQKRDNQKAVINNTKRRTE